MWPAVAAAAIAAAAQGASSGASMWSSSKSSRRAWKQAKEAAQNAHQWEVNDLRAAGLNPILSATGGSGASANGFMATAPMIDFNEAIKSGTQSAQMRQEIENSEKLTNAQVENLGMSSAHMLNQIDNDTERTRNEVANGLSLRALQSSQAANTDANTLLAAARTGLVKGQTAQLGIQSALIRAQTDAAKASAYNAISTGLQARETARGLRMTNNYYAEDPRRIDYRETAKATGSNLGAAYIGLDKVSNWLGNFFGGNTRGSSAKYFRFNNEGDY